MSPFDFVNSINAGTRGPNLLEGSCADLSISGKDPEDPINDYNAFIINRALSQFYDTVLLANEMNLNHGLPQKMQFDFLRGTVRAKKRFTKWAKATADGPEIAAICKLYDYSKVKARAAATLMTRTQLDSLILKASPGGRTK